MTAQILKGNRNGSQNTLNHLEGKEWIKFTKSWFVLNPSPRKSKIMHPASFPEGLATKFIKFFTKKNQWVLDPFAGCASTLVSAKSLNRNSIGIELYADYVALAEERLGKVSNSDSESVILQGDSRHLKEIFYEKRLPKADFCFTSPPYWNQLKRDSDRQQIRLENGLNTVYGADKRDLGVIESYYSFLHELEIVFDNVYEIMIDGAYLVVVSNNVYAQGRLWPLAFDTFRMLSKRWTPKDERIWCQNDKKLFPFGMFHTYVGNRSHHYCLIFRKDINSREWSLSQGSRPYKEEGASKQPLSIHQIRSELSTH